MGADQGGADEEPKSGEWTAEAPTPAGVGLPARDKVEPFAAIHHLLREHRVQVVMAGDTHYFEVYRENYEADGAFLTMHHFVNGGGGAYLSIGTPLDWPAKPAVPDCALYPRTDALIAKLDRETPIWKEPLWQWAKRLCGWPFSAETLAGAFNYNQAPFFQSFLEIRVENSKDRIVLVPHGVNGPLRWRDLQTFGQVVPAGKNEGDLVEFEYELPKGQL